MNKTLTVFASQEKDALVPNIQALSANPPQRRFVGWKYNPEAGEAGGWERKSEPETIPYHNDYVKAIKEGDLLPADKQTAYLCGIPWESRKSNQDKQSTNKG